MHRSRRSRSRLFRCLLVVAMLAWVALAFDAVAAASVMSGAPAGAAAATMGAAAVPCDHATPMAMSHDGHDHVSPPSMADGHGCCQQGGCHCASLCNAVMGVAGVDLPAQRSHMAARALTPPAPALAHAAPPLRPPIA